MRIVKIVTACSKCLFEETSNKPVPEICLADYDEELCCYQCSKGHITYTRIQNDRYELLFDSSIIAYFDDYYRESVLNASSSLESFYEYMIKAMLFIFKKMSMEQIDDFYKKFKSRSECREGVFQALSKVYLDKDFFLTDKSKKLRNDTIHNGYFPKNKETLKYLKEIYTIIYDCFGVLMKNVETLEYVEFGFALQKKISDKHSQFYANMYIPTVLSDSTITGDFEKDIDGLKKRSSYMYNKKFDDKVGVE